MKKIECDVNQFPSLTWHHLHINHGKFEGSFSKKANLAFAPLDAALEYSLVRPVRKGFESIQTQLGKEFDAKFTNICDELSLERDFFIVQENAHVQNSCTLNISPSDEGSLLDISICAKSGSESCFILDFSSAKNDSSLAVTLRLFLEPYSVLKICTINCLENKTNFALGIASSVAENAKLSLVQLDLGGKNVCSGSQNELLGFNANFTGHYAYLAKGDSEFDINYISRHIGKQTKSSFFTGGVILDSAKKAWRGTIDFVNGSSSSVGDEQENVLVLSENCVNKSLPVILCGEENVEGRHGCSIGRLGSDVLFYMKNRGFSEEEAKRMVVRAKISAVCRFIPDSKLQEKIQNVLEGAI